MTERQDEVCCVDEGKLNNNRCRGDRVTGHVIFFKGALWIYLPHFQFGFDDFRRRWRRRAGFED